MFIRPDPFPGAPCDPQAEVAIAARRRFVRACGALAAASLAGVATATRAQAVAGGPPIRFVVPYSAGGTTDLVARTVGARMAALLGQPVVIDNRGGAGGNIGMDLVAKAAPDGLTLGMGAISTNALNPHIYRSMAFDPRRDFTAIGLLGHSTIVLEVGPAMRVRTVAELLDHARAHPGTPYGTAGAGTSMHLAGVLFAQRTGTQWTHVPYKGSAPLLNDLLGGQIGVAFDNLPASLPHIQAGRLRALAVAGRQRAPALPNVPTLAEAGIADYVVEPWFGVYGPAGLPAPVAQRLEAALRQAVADPEVGKQLRAAGFTPQASSARELHELTQREYERLGRVAREAAMTAQ